MVRLPSSKRGKQRNRTPADLLVVGLGNPTIEYEQTRHNAGVWVINELVARHNGRLAAARRDRAEAVELRVGDKRLAVAIPKTFMNDSGSAVAPLVRRYGIEDPEQSGSRPRRNRPSGRSDEGQSRRWPSRS